MGNKVDEIKKSQGDKDSTVISVRIPIELHTKIKEVSENTGVPYSFAVRQALRGWLSKVEIDVSNENQGKVFSTYGNDAEFIEPERSPVDINITFKDGPNWFTDIFPEKEGQKLGGQLNKKSETNKYQEVFTDSEAQKFLRVSRITLWKLRRSGGISFSKIGRKILYRRSDLEQLLDVIKQNVVVTE